VTIEPGEAPLQWDASRSRWRRRAGAEATVVATNGRAMLVRVALRPDLHVGAHVDVVLAEGSGTVAIRHVAPIGDDDGVSLVGVEFVTTDDALTAHLEGRAHAAGGGGIDRWWWQEGP
jgi:hypothetical protein